MKKITYVLALLYAVSSYGQSYFNTNKMTEASLNQNVSKNYIEVVDEDLLKENPKEYYKAKLILLYKKYDALELSYKSRIEKVNQRIKSFQNTIEFDTSAQNIIYTKKRDSLKIQKSNLVSILRENKRYSKSENAPIIISNIQSIKSTTILLEKYKRLTDSIYTKNYDFFTNEILLLNKGKIIFDRKTQKNLDAIEEEIYTIKKLLLSAIKQQGRSKRKKKY